jgi:hypothetical protein
MTITDELDQQMRTAAFIHVRRMLELRDPLNSEDLASGFMFQGGRIPLINPQRGIFKPSQMKYALSNGLLLRKDLHALFDDGYLTVTANYRIEVSRRIREEFENGREYYQHHGEPLKVLPSDIQERPSQELLAWHNSNVFLG